MNINEARALKRNRSGYDAPCLGNEHIMMKHEAKVMRRLRAETGLSEVEIRGCKKYRKMLSDAQKTENHRRDFRTARDILKRITRELKLPKEHPDVVKAVREYVNTKENNIGCFSLGLRYGTKSILFSMVRGKHKMK